MPFISTSTAVNPLLEIDTDFSHYVGARRQSVRSEFLVDGKLDYVFDADSQTRNKLSGLSGVGKFLKPVNPYIGEKYRKVLSSSTKAGSLKYPESYAAVLKCATRLSIGVPTLFVTINSSEYKAFSLEGDGIPEPCIVITSAAAENFSEEELLFILGRECGRIQNEQTLLRCTAEFYGLAGIESDRRSTLTDSAIKNVLKRWYRYSDITCDRAGIICLNNPVNFLDVLKSTREKGITGIYENEIIDSAKIRPEYDTLHFTPARSITLGDSVSTLKRRMFCALEFASCEILYSRRSDLQRAGLHLINKQALEVRCEIIGA
ncbi:MAG: hypothetical protein LBM87_00515 [Ruminococcus sp.]|jgi:hypothetical protein|nr:hypothetical protein [Ruminococcus sp.]